MKTIPYKETPFFSPLIIDYLAQKESLKPFYNHFPNLENFKKQIQEKGKNYPQKNRAILVETIKLQYNKFSLHSSVSENIFSLKKETTFTVTTGHQLNLFTGPLYFIYKIISTIKTVELLNSEYTDYHFVPIYWMATEDHDFEEINHFHLHNKTFRWQNLQTGAVGDFGTESLSKLAEILKYELGVGKKAKYLSELFSKAYLQHPNLASATRYIVNELFGKYGLVILDGNNNRLKSLFTPYLLSEIEQQKAYQKVLKQSEKLTNINPHYPIQVQPREINLFYLSEGIRERIVQTDDTYEILNTKISFSRETLREELQNHPERFSPNVIIRPLYQEVILPNLCYIGGGGELAYWLQLRSYFNEENVTFPILLLRNSVLLITEKQIKKASKLNLSFKDLFLPKQQLLAKKTKELSQIKIDFSSQKEYLKKQFKELYQLAEQTDVSFLNAVKAQEIKQIKGLNHLEKRLLKAQKRKLNDVLTRISALQNEIFPEGGLQERKNNFSEFQLQNSQLINLIMEEIQPLNLEFSIIKI